ncbi:UDP-N-acetylglucosamine 2-epimerase (non-hydrolyzing) [Candidatus Cerribacteria bacterium 'Amazon FNV 2010 28 9']|uniref:UDP-N-acetylglucosamine 2-epimerase (Non-hydrolyzing) n=1 Tax=Candidatus Cerribacteria bacterium 'Amazon FNV 2010 28 9' TaxID=2081795 RepID=A0A317JP11_9BACT|nr:MAG: UDP-N-acetylglucosamine 2-epimerase (non-hydrolyzing) [Candidatus Cerribacteria bacterium 'Amazon FNV 2010 28 9']
MKKKIAFILGIRPDIIRAALIMKYLRAAKDVQVIFIWSGQHYSDNLKGIFFRELHMPKPDYELGCQGETDAEISSQLIGKLYPLLEKIKPDAVAFLGDTNTTTGCIAVAQLNIPLIHVEGCWHSYDWRMPEEKFRTLIDHLSDVIYTYEEEYKQRGVAEGLNPKNIVVVGNPIVDVLNEFYFKRKKSIEKKATRSFFAKRNIEEGKYYLMTCHRRENVHIKNSFLSIMKLVEQAPQPVYFPASYRTQKVMQQMAKNGELQIPKNLIITDPVGYEEILILMTHAIAVFTDSGTMVEETCVLNIPTVQMRKATERPEVYDAGGCVKFDPDQIKKYPPKVIFKKLDAITGKHWAHSLGDGKSSKRIADDIIERLRTNKLRGHLYKDNHLPIERSLLEDGIVV